MIGFPITVDFAENGGVFQFRTVEDLRAFLNEQTENWSWLPSLINSTPNPNGDMNDLAQKWPNHVGNINGINQQLEQGRAGSAKSVLESYFGTPTSLPITTSIRGSIVMQARQELGDRAALGALAAVLRTRFYGGDPEAIRGVYLAHEALQGTGQAARQSVQKALSTLLRRFSEQQLRVEKKADELDRQVDRIEQRRRQQFEKLVALGARARRAYAEKIGTELQNYKAEGTYAIDAINNTKKTFEEHMRLRAPVTYWRDKAVEHKATARWSAAIGLAFSAVLVGYACIWGIHQVLDLVEQAMNQTHQWQVGYVVLSIVIFILAILFWIGRLISRTYVSQTHLSIDAEERATMVETYLALTAENKISEAERILVLHSLFRASSDGLVKDDAAPDLTLPGLASRALSGEGAGR